MALWGNNDAVGSGGTVSLNYGTGVVTGSGTTFGQTGAAQEGDVIRFGIRGGNGVHLGDAVITSIASATSLTIGSTAGLSGASIAGTDFTVSQLPKSSILDSHYSETQGDFDSLVYGVSPNGGGSFHAAHEGWVGVTTYIDGEGVLRVKKEVLVAMSGITTATDGFAAPIAYPTAE